MRAVTSNSWLEHGSEGRGQKGEIMFMVVIKTLVYFSVKLQAEQSYKTTLKNPMKQSISSATLGFLHPSF